MLKSYEEAKKHAQTSADMGGHLYRVRYSTYDNEWTVRMVPQLRHQFGSERRGELVEPSDHDAMLKARGPGGETTSDPETAAQRARALGGHE